MTILLYEMTRDQIKEMAPKAVAVLPTASIEQHGPHLPVCTDSLLCETVAQRATAQAGQQVPVVVTPILYFGNSHHHFPFAGVLSLTSQTFMTAVTEILEGLVKSGFRKLVVLNGHGGNTDSNAVVGLDFVHRLKQPVSIATAAYWSPLN
jgi:creatinine amidohydrolase